jgi:para-aminobenzoate synthetase / 4-amino-4-deoxychorismate lyase
MQDALRAGGPGRPDPARGVGATLLVAAGAAQELDAHLADLAASTRALYGVAPAEEQLGAAGARARVTVRPDGVTRVTSKAFRPPAPGGPPVRLVPFLLPGGLGAHDWADRRLADDLDARAGEGALALLLDGDGEVLEPVGETVFVVRDGELVGPPLDDRRRHAVAAARLPVARRERLDLDVLRAADQVVVVSSLHGVRPAEVAA